MINDDQLAAILSVARFHLSLLPKDPSGVPLSPQQIEAVVRGVPDGIVPGVTDLGAREALLKEAARRLELEQRVQIADPTVLRSTQSEWYVGERKLNRPFWMRYQRLLRFGQSFDAKTVAAIDKGSDAVVAGLGDPRDPGPFDARGLVVGQVQSGKTTSYSAVINKAIDAGYRVIIVLTGLHEGLRAQTQKRIEEGVRGLATDSGQAGVATKDQALPLHHEGEVPCIPAMLTTRASDFSSSAQHFASLSGNAPVILVIKKNAIILRHVQEFFKESHVKRVYDIATGRNEIDGLPLLLIDDEADAASIDTKIKKKKNDDEYSPATINREIRRLLLMFRQRSYAAYTATPYANILIHKNNETVSEGPDLFPRDFVVMLPAPSNYVGPSVFFGQGSVDEEESQVRPDLVRIVKDCGIQRDPEVDWMPLLHKKEHKPRSNGEEDIPGSLRDAILSFLLATTVRRLRGHKNAHNSMLVHVSRYKDVQKKVLDQVSTFLYEVKGSLEGIGDSVQLTANLNHRWQDFTVSQATLSPDDRGMLPVWPEVLAALRETVELVQPRAINSTETGGLNYEASKNGLNVVAIGGDKLSRGLTLEGLTVSYFLRSTKMYDTLLQMGRWFGYRPGYKDLCRLYVTQDLADAYGHVTKADEELRAEFASMQDQIPPLRPEDYGLRIRSHPTLLITSLGKMASGEKLHVDFGGKVSQTIHFVRDADKVLRNREITCALLESIAAKEVALPEGKRGALFKNVSEDAIEAFLATYQFSARSRRLAPEKLMSYLRSAWKVGVAQDWTVYLASGGRDGTPVSLGNQYNTFAVKRGASVSDPQAYEIGVLSSPEDLTIDLAKAPKEIAGAKSKAEAEQKASTKACQMRPETTALLVLYVVDPTKLDDNALDANSANEKKKKISVCAAGELLPIGFAIALPSSNKVKLPDYVVNSVLVDELEQEFSKVDELEGA